MSAYDALESAIRESVTDLWPEAVADHVARWVVAVALVPSDIEDVTTYVYLTPDGSQSLDVTLGLLEVTRRNLIHDSGLFE